MLIAIDTSTAQVGLALYDGAQVLGEMTWTTRRHHTTELAPALSGLLSRCGVAMDVVCALGVAVGPGSFTSLRVGLSLAKGIALARNLPLIGIPTLNVIAAAQPAAKQPLVAVLQAGRKRIAYGVYQSTETGWQAEGGVRSGTVDELFEGIGSPAIIAGEIHPEDRRKFSRKKKITLASPAYCMRRPSVLAELAWARWQADDVDDAASLAPVYLHVAGTSIE